MKYHIYPVGNGTFGVTEQGRRPATPEQSGSALRGLVNPMPGATSGFASIRQASLAIRILERVRTQRRAPADFWPIYDRVTGKAERARVERQRQAARLGLRVVRIARNEFCLAPPTWGQAS